MAAIDDRLVDLLQAQVGDKRIPGLRRSPRPLTGLEKVRAARRRQNQDRNRSRFQRAQENWRRAHGTQ